MRVTTRRLTATLLVAGVLLAGACGGDDKDDAGAASTTTAAAPASPADDGSSTTVAADPGSSTTAVESGDEGDGGAGTVAPDTVQQPDEGAGAPDEEAADVDWAKSATEYRGRDGERIAFLCPPDGDLSHSVWGTDTYTDDSAVCVAAVHQGIITTVEGGRVVIEIAPGEESYAASTAHGVTTLDYGAWSGSYTFPAS